MDSKQVVQAIIGKQWSAEELNEIIEATRYAMDRRTRQVKGTITAGTRIKFQSRRHGLVRGVVTKVNTKRLVVKQHNGPTWRVDASMCSVDMDPV